MVDFGGLFSKTEKQNPWTPKGELALEKGLYEEASAYFAKAVEHEPANSQLWTKLGDSHKLLLKYDNAVRAYAKATELDADNKHAWVNLALILGNTGKYEEAVSAISHVVLPESETYLKDLKCEWLQRCGKYKEAASVCSHLVSLNPKNTQYRIRYAELLMRSGAFAEAKTFFDDLIRNTDEKKSNLLADAGFCCEMMGDVDGAVKRYSELAEADSLGWYRRARLEESRGNFKDAAIAYGMVQHFTTADDITVNVRRAMSLFWSGNGKEAANQLEKILAKGYANAELWYMMGVVSFLNGSMKRAVASFVEYIHLNHANNTVWYMKGCAEYLSGKYTDALESFAKMSKLSSGVAPAKMKWFSEDKDMDLFDEATTPAVKEPVKVEIGVVNEGLLTMQAYSLAVLGKYAEADKAAKAVLAESPERTDMDLLHSRCLRGLGKYKASSDASSLVISKDSENTEALMQYASAQMMLGKYAEAEIAWSKIIELSPENSLAHAGLISCSLGTGNYAQAKEHAESFLENYLPTDLTTTLDAGTASFSAGLYEDAVKHYTNAVSIGSEIPAGYLGLGHSLEMLGRYSEAEAAFVSAAELMQGSPAVLISLARVQASSKDKEAATETYLKVLNTYPEIPGVAVQVAKLCADLGRYDDAADAVALAVSSGNASFDLIVLGGDVCFAIGKTDDALNYYTQARELAPENIHVLTALAHTYLQHGSYKETVSLADEILSHEPENKHAMSDKAIALVNLGKLVQAEDVYKKLTETEPDAESLLAYASVLEQQHKYDEALEVYAKYLEFGVANSDVIRKLSAIYLVRGEYEEALSGYEILLESNPSDMVTKRLKAEALCYVGNYADAAASCNEILAEHPDDLALRYMYASTLAYSGDSESAVKEYASVVKGDMNNSSALFGYADVLMRLGKYPESIKVLNKVIELYPKNTAAYLEKSLATVKIGEPRECVESFVQTSSANPRNPYVLTGLGFMQMATGHPTDALASFDKATAVGCSDPDVDYCRGLVYLEQKRFDLADKSADAVLKRFPQNVSAWHLKAKALDGSGNIKDALYCFNKIIEITSEPKEAEPMPDVQEEHEPELSREEPVPEEHHRRSVNGFSFDD